MTKTNLSGATCYYRTRASRWTEEFGNILFILAGSFISLTGSNGSSGTFMWMTPMLFGEVIAILGFILLAGDLPTLFYTGPTLAISKEGLYYEFKGGTLALIPWEDIDYFAAGTWGRWQTPIINMFIKNKSDLFAHVEEQLGGLPVLVLVQKTFKRASFPFVIFAKSFTSGSRDSILEELKSAIAHHREGDSEGGVM
jgi:hypothetical protein